MINAATRQQLDCLFPPGRGAYFELRTFPRVPKGAKKPNPHRLFVSIDKPDIGTLDTFLTDKVGRSHEIYVGVNPRTKKGGEKEDVSVYSTCFTDLDGAKWDALPKPLPLPPSLVISSGGGTHIYWLTDTTNRREWEAAQKGIYAYFKAHGADNQVVTDEARVLRLVPFHNRKFDPPVPTSIILCNKELRYPIERIREAFPFTMPETREERMARRAATFDGRLKPDTIQFLAEGASPEARKTAMGKALDDLCNAGISEDDATPLLLDAATESGFTMSDARNIIMRRYGHDPGSAINPMDRCIAYLEKLPNAVQGSRGSNPTFQAACTCWRFGLTRAEADSVMSWYSETKCVPPWPKNELDHKLDSAFKTVQGDGSFGKLAAEPPKHRAPPRDRRMDRSDEDDNAAAAPSNTSPATPPSPPTEKPPRDEPAPKKRLPALYNTQSVTIPDPDNPENNKKIKRYKPPAEILGEVFRVTDEWPRRISDQLSYVHRRSDKSQEIRHIESTDQFFAWLHHYFDGVVWDSGDCWEIDRMHRRKALSKNEFFEYVKAFVKHEYSGYSVYPHHPPRPDLFYLDWNREKSDDGAALGEFYGTLNAQGELDRAILLAMMVTTVWGGGAGLRPAFILSSDHGRGSGKSETCKAIAEFVGGLIDMLLSSRAAERNRERMLSDKASRVRCVLFDNVKTKIEGQDIESMITQSDIQGHKMYVGQASVPNYYLYMFSVNSPTASYDIAERSFEALIGKQNHDFNFTQWWPPFVRKNREFVINACLDLLADKSLKFDVPDGVKDRWGSWIEEVLIPVVSYLNPGDHEAAYQMLTEIMSRNRAMRTKINTDAEELEIIHECLLDYIGRVYPNVEGVAVQFRTMPAGKFIADKLMRSKEVLKILAMLNKAIGKPPFELFSHFSPSNKSYYRYTGKNVPRDTKGGVIGRYEEIQPDRATAGGGDGDS